MVVKIIDLSDLYSKQNQEGYNRIKQKLEQSFDSPYARWEQIHRELFQYTKKLSSLEKQLEGYFNASFDTLEEKQLSRLLEYLRDTKKEALDVLDGKKKI